MVQCYVPLCHHRSDKNVCKFRRFPRDEKMKRKWINLIRRKDTLPSDTSFVCACHFVNLKTSEFPSLFEWNNNKLFQYTSPIKRKRSVASKKNKDEEININFNETGPDPVNFEERKTKQEFSSMFYESQIYFLNKEINILKEDNSRLQKQSFGFFTVGTSNKLCLHYTGLEIKIFELVCDLVSDVEFTYLSGSKVTVLSIHDQIFLTLLKLRRNLTYIDISTRFGISTATVNRVFNTMINVLHEILFQNFMSIIPSQRKNNLCLPGCFKTFENCRIILDCTEVQCDIPANMNHQQLTYSNYKSRNTLKVLIGCSPNGSITFCSEFYPGCISDKGIVKHTNILEYLKPGDLILADKGFFISDMLPQGVSLNIPPFLRNPQFTSSEIYETRRIAKARIHVERVINRLKGFTILNYIPSSLFYNCTTIVQLCAALTNFQSPILQEIEQLYNISE